MSNTPISYSDAGVNIDAMNESVLRMRDFVRSTFTPGVLTDVGSFGGMFSLDWKSFEDPILVSSIDGVGTKLKVAIAMNRHDTIGIDLVSHCVDDILVQGARPLFFLDYFSTGKLSPDVVVSVVKGLSAGCRLAGCALIGGETAEMPGMYADGEYDIAGTIVGVVDRPRVVDGKTIRQGDVVVGLASSGLHTNGYSLGRKVLFEVAGYSVDSCPDELGGATVGETLLAPHRCYATPVLGLMDDIVVKGMAHITGGGFIDNIPRILPEGTSVEIDTASWSALPIFGLIERHGQVPKQEMFRTFNMGIGMTLFVAPEDVEEAVSQLNGSGESARVIGRVVAGDRKVTLL